MKIEVSDELVDRFRDKVEPEPNSGCWLWSGSAVRGYGYFDASAFGLGNFRAHRLSYLLFRGPIPNHLFVCHHCDTPACVNPDHLFLGTARDNSRDYYDKVRAGRLPKPRKTPRERVIRKPVKKMKRGRQAPSTTTVEFRRLLVEGGLLQEDGKPFPRDAA